MYQRYKLVNHFDNQFQKNLLRRKAAEEVKRQQEIRERERQKAISERTGKPKPTHDCNEGLNLDR